MSRWDDIKALLDVPHPVSGAWDADYVVATEQMNAANITRIRASMSGSEMWAATDPTEYSNLMDAQKTQWLSFCAIDNHNPEAGGLAQLFVVDLFGGGSTTVSALATQRGELISLAIKQGLGTVQQVDIKKARAI